MESEMETIGKIIIDRQTSKGRLQIGWSADGYWLVVNLDGKYSGARAGHDTFNPPKMVRGAAIHGAAYSNLGGFALFAGEPAALDAARAEIRAARAKSPEGLLQKRRDLVDAIRYANEEASEIRERAWSREDEMAWAKADPHGAVAAAKTALIDFDAANPAILAMWNEKAEAQRSAELENQINYRGE